MVPVSGSLALGAILFIIGAIGALSRRNAIIILMSIELMLNAVNLTFVTFSYQVGNLNGQIAAIFVMAVAAAEASVGLAIFIALYRKKRTANVDEISILKW